MNREPATFIISGWLYTDAGRQLRIVHHTRRRVVVETGAGRVELNRARLERDGHDVANGTVCRVSRYALPLDQEIAS